MLLLGLAKGTGRDGRGTAARGKVAADPLGVSNPTSTFFKPKSPLFFGIRQILGGKGEGERNRQGGPRAGGAGEGTGGHSVTVGSPQEPRTPFVFQGIDQFGPPMIIHFRVQYYVENGRLIR